MCCLLNAFGNNYELQLIFLQERKFSKCVQVWVVLNPPASNLKSLQKSFSQFWFPRIVSLYHSLKAHVIYEFWKKTNLEIGKKSTSSPKLINSVPPHPPCSLMGLLFWFHFGWFIPCAPTLCGLPNPKSFWLTLSNSDKNAKPQGRQ